MMKRVRAASKLTIMMVLIVIAVGAYVWFRDGDDESPGRSGTGALRSAEPIETSPSPSKDRDEPVVAEPAAPELRFPEVEDIRREVAEDPHRTPPSIARFSERIATEMEKALGSRAFAGKLFEELRVCAEDSRSALPLSVRTICTVNAGRLSSRFSDFFEAEFDALLAGLPREQQDLYMALSTKSRAADGLPQ